MNLINNPPPNKENFEAVCNDIEHGAILNMHHIGLVFGQAFWELLVVCLVDAKYTMLPDEIEKARKE